MLLAKHLAIHSFFAFICELLINVFIERVDIAQSSAHLVKNLAIHWHMFIRPIVGLFGLFQENITQIRGRETQFLDLGVRFRILDTVIFFKVYFFSFFLFF